jgi:hypothetical protein
MCFRDRIFDNLSANAYSIYLSHYIFVVWLQYLLISLAFTAIGKAIIVFAGALGLSWAASAGVNALLAMLPGWRGREAIVAQRR